MGSSFWDSYNQWTKQENEVNVRLKWTVNQSKCTLASQISAIKSLKPKSVLKKKYKCQITGDPKHGLDSKHLHSKPKS